MSTQETTDRWQEIRAIYQNKDNQFFYQILGGGFLVLIGILIGGGLFSDDPGYKTNLYTEVLSIGITVMILNALAERRRILDLQERLVMEAGSQSNETAKRAIDELRYRGWLKGENGLLKGKNLREAKLQEGNLQAVNLQRANLWKARLEEANLSMTNLQGADLIAANLQGADLIAANLRRADLTAANLQRAELAVADLQEANLIGADLQEANLTIANLQKANLELTNLQGTDLSDANLQGAKLVDTKFDEDTKLPDKSNWTSETDMTRFTDPKHPNFWRSGYKISPAYRGKS